MFLDWRSTNSAFSSSISTTYMRLNSSSILFWATLRFVERNPLFNPILISDRPPRSSFHFPAALVRLIEGRDIQALTFSHHHRVLGQLPFSRIRADLEAAWPELPRRLLVFAISLSLHRHFPISVSIRCLSA